MKEHSREETDRREGAPTWTNDRLGSAVECKGDPRAGYSMGGAERLGHTLPERAEREAPLLYHLSLVCVH